MQSDKAAPRIRRKSSAIKVSLSRSNTYSSSPSDDVEPDASTLSGSAGAGKEFSVPNVPSHSLSSALENLKTTVNRRIVSWNYMKQAHEGKAHWFNTILLEPDELATAFEHSKMKTRTTRLAVLGMSLSALLDISSAHDFLRGLQSLLQEFDAVQEDKFDTERRNRSVFRVTGGRPKKSGGGDFSMGLQDSGDASYLFTPNIPFELDYFQVLFTTCDLLVETFQKILSYLGPAPTSATAPSAFPRPPSSYGPGNGVGVGMNGQTGGLSPALTDVVMKIDAKLMKLSNSLTKDVDALARRSIKNELNSLSAGFDWSMGDVGLVESI